MARIRIEELGKEHLTIEIQEQLKDGTWVSKGVGDLRKNKFVEVELDSGIRILVAPKEPVEKKDPEKAKSKDKKNDE